LFFIDLIDFDRPTGLPLQAICKASSRILLQSEYGRQMATAGRMPRNTPIAVGAPCQAGRFVLGSMDTKAFLIRGSSFCIQSAPLLLVMADLDNSLG
jgi:hypothetical protein